MNKSYQKYCFAETAQKLVFIAAAKPLNQIE
jgi:hypothetical protein